jgi:hypothetical protein
MIAHVCAHLVAHGDAPDDLAVIMPDLEEAVVALLAHGTARELEPIGAVR